MKAAVFLSRIDTVNNKGEGEVYMIEKSGITNCDVWQSPRLSDHQVIIAVGQKAIDEVYNNFQDNGYLLIKK